MSMAVRKKIFYNIFNITFYRVNIQLQSMVNFFLHFNNDWIIIEFLAVMRSDDVTKSECLSVCLCVCLSVCSHSLLFGAFEAYMMLNEATGVSQVVSRVFQGWSRGRSEGVSRVFHGSSKSVLKMFWGCAKGISGVFQGCSMNVLWVLQGCFNVFSCDKQLKKGHCHSVRPSVRPSVRVSVPFFFF